MEGLSGWNLMPKFIINPVATQSFSKQVHTRSVGASHLAVQKRQTVCGDTGERRYGSWAALHRCRQPPLGAICV